MAQASLEEYRRLMTKAREYHKKALWQEKLRLLQEALALCDSDGFPEAAARKQELFHDLGAIWRSSGQYQRAELVLQQSLQAFPDSPPLKRANILGELVVVLRHSNRFKEAQDISREQYQLATTAAPSIEQDVELCRAIGNEGMINYNMSQVPEYAADATALLDSAFVQLRERVARARALQARVARESNERWGAMAKSWEIIGLDRMTLCHVALGETKEAVRLAEDSQSRQTRDDPTVTAHSRFYYGNALWKDGQKEAAIRQWNAPQGTCSSPMAFCKEPAKEHTEYLKLMAEAGVDFDSYDEQGFSALDYAVLTDNPDAKETLPIIRGALRAALSKTIQQSALRLSRKDTEFLISREIDMRERQAELRRQYRTILQEHIRPELRIQASETFEKLRAIYARFLAEDTKERRMFASFRYLKFPDLVKHAKLPMSSAGLARTPVEYKAMQSLVQNVRGDFIIFISYRWLGGGVPDLDDCTQWQRIVDAVDKFLANNTQLQKEQIGIWLDYACIDQEDDEEKERGVDALPLAVTLCNAMISFVDNDYYDRAWCAVEVMLMQALMESYSLHAWWEHVLDSPHVSRSKGSLRQGRRVPFEDIAGLKLSEEKLDRPKIDFLVRQSKLLGKDDA